MEPLLLVAFGKVLRLVAVPLFVSAMAGIIFSFSPNSWGVPWRAFASLVCIVWAMAIVSMAAKAGWRARWRRCLGLIVILLLVLPTCDWLGFWAGDYVHLLALWPSYRSIIKTDPGNRVLFEWETVEMMFGQIQRVLVYDPTGSAVQKTDIPYNYYDGTFTSHRHLIGHFYLIECSPWVQTLCGLKVIP